MELIAIGHDVVDVAAFASQLAEPGSRMRELFSVRELRQCAMRAQIKHDSESAHLAARWAGKEAVLKAWCEALGDVPNPYTLDDFPWAGVEILDDSRSRPHVVLRADVEATLRESLGFATEVESLPVAAQGVAGAAAQGVAESGAAAQSKGLQWHISLSHDGPIASAVVTLGLA
ncbi:MAG: 4'-phosphopantetheinyl transferase superfamily protein [Bifidobacterium tibiigranuli]|jgi:holo-[acyl-carrier protein] synthase|uniref:holo-ACP synthase n=1 Tax=Bifidobacterium tibiigranuli TaxID=2172043 RepID=UPI0026E9C9FC|nr:4'-phosphopantetheinyl transferase superfamily protein [Bifidobacterium tibiigranuli]MCI1673033.1 4'-phosphopantetheinyl transferase superfamily protein [Bifidobacterium tibiigranuli]MCI1713133.1 4'-phosphopantetheinyl transferase superfamily protein [Bifidobacterium tibiigranuli]MCI1834881.1 4'-phosphopantetheinyl transferase superfamily protein [Bifidobacterium tibiigranuli]